MPYCHHQYTSPWEVTLDIPEDSPGSKLGPMSQLEMMGACNLPAFRLTGLICWIVLSAWRSIANRCADAFLLKRGVFHPACWVKPGSAWTGELEGWAWHWFFCMSPGYGIFSLTHSHKTSSLRFVSVTPGTDDAALSSQCHRELSQFHFLFYMNLTVKYHHHDGFCVPLASKARWRTIDLDSWFFPFACKDNWVCYAWRLILSCDANITGLDKPHPCPWGRRGYYPSSSSQSCCPRAWIWPRVLA